MQSDGARAMSQAELEARAIAMAPLMRNVAHQAIHPDLMANAYRPSQDLETKPERQVSAWQKWLLTLRTTLLK